MGLLTDITDAFGLTDSKAGEEAAKMAQFNPYNIRSSYGSLDYDRANRTFTSSMDPRLQGITSGLFSRYGQVSPEQQLSLFRQQAAPFNEQAMLNLENRLFSQGRLDHSALDQPGGARRGLFDSILNQDLQFQLMAEQQAQQAQNNYLNQILGLTGLEQNLFNAGMGMGQIGIQGQIAGANAYLSNSQFTADMTKQIVDSIAGGAMQYFTGGFGGMGG